MLFRFFFFLSLFPSPPPDSSHPRSDHPSPSATPMDSLFFRSFLYLGPALCFRQTRIASCLGAVFALFSVLVLFVSIRCVVCMLNFIAIQQMCANVFCVLFSRAFAEMVLTCRNMHTYTHTHGPQIESKLPPRQRLPSFLLVFLFRPRLSSPARPVEAKI